MARMPNAVLTKVRGDGDYVQFAKLRKEVYKNLSAVSTTYGAPDNGHLGPVMNDVKYSVRIGAHCAVPLNPGIYDVTIGMTVSHVKR